MSRQLALQLYTVRRPLLEDFSGTLRRIREIGFRAIETFPLPTEISVAQAAETFKSLELAVVSLHTPLPEAHTIPEILGLADAFQCRRVIWHGWPRAGEYDSISGIQRLAARYTAAFSQARENGLELGLHNHWWEFERIGADYPYRILQKLLPAELFWEIDTYWVQTAGLDPARVIEELRPRVRILHLKDGPAVHGAPMTAVGEGTLNFPRILKAAPDEVDLIVELDECATDIFEAIDRSYRRLRGSCASI